MTRLKNKFLFLGVLLVFCSAAAQAGLFGISPKDRKEFVRAREKYDQGNYRQAVTELSEYIYKTKNIKRREARAYRLLGLSYERLGNPAKALETYLEALEFHQKNIPLLLAAASLYQRTGLTDRSIELYNRALKWEPDNLEALSGQGENYINMGFYSKAREYYDRFFELNPRAPAINRARYAYTFLKQRNYAGALINITMALTEEPENADYWLLSAKAYKGLGRPQDAQADLDAAVLLAPQRTELKAMKSMWFYQEGLLSMARAQAQQILSEQPQNELALFMMYLTAQKEGRPREARTYLQKIHTQDKDSLAHKVAEKLLARP